jgi:hypothetical protein
MPRAAVSRTAPGPPDHRGPLPQPLTAALLPVSRSVCVVPAFAIFRRHICRLIALQ